MAAVPVVKGLTDKDAQHQLRAAGLEIGRITRKPSSQPAGTVLAQGMRKGAQVEAGTKVPLVIAVPLPRVPAVVGQAAAGAQAKLRQAGYAVKTVYRTQTSGQNGVVLGQTPRGGTPAKKGTPVTLTILKVVAPPPPPPQQSCTPGYSPCLPPASDYDCAGGSGDGPKYAYGPIRVTGSDPYRLDADGDGVACED